MSTDSSLSRVVIVGGGTSGWMAAAVLRRALRPDCKITLIESPQIGRIGVGEATVPSIKEEVFDFIGLSEEEWMPACNATFKLGIKYVDWAQPPGTTPDNYFYHLFGEVENVDDIPLTHYWLREKLRGSDTPLAYRVYPTAPTCDAKRSPMFLGGKLASHYAYHFDAQVVADFLRDHAVAQGVEHVEGKVVDVKLDERGFITAVVTECGKNLSGDFFVDCTGFRGRLLNEALGEPFIPFSDNLLCDRAVALNIKTDDERDGINPFTTARALSSGWVWQIPLMGRTGNGYVYSSQFLSPEDAEQEFLGMLGDGEPVGEVRHLKMRVGRTRRSWVKNCVGIGLSSAFIEPLESTGIYFIYAALYQLLKYFPDQNMDRRLQDKFNERVAFMVDDVRDFIVMHYCTTSRQDTAFWRANRHDLVIPDSLAETLELYKAGVPIKVSYSGDLLYKQFDASFDRFWSNSNYLAILAGMGVLPERELPLLAHRKESVAAATKRLEAIRRRSRELVDLLPSHYEYLTHQMGSKAVAPTFQADAPIPTAATIV